MQFTNLLAVAVLLAGSALAAPAPGAPEKPSKPEHQHPPPPPPPTTVNQQNSCGSGNAPYCCNTDNFGKYTTCKVIGKASSQCSQTTVCCNANNSIQICLGNAIIEP